MPDEHPYVQEQHLWQEFVESESLTDEQSNQFKQYQKLMIDWNERINLTTITDLADIINYHFKDSLAIKDAIDLYAVDTIADIGSGAGFPGIPLKIAYPHLRVILIEVVQKKVNFLNFVIKELGLTNIEVVSLDWLTFLRKSDRIIDLFCSRAALAPKLLVTMFAPWCRYKRAKLIYWAATSWEKTIDIVPFLEKEVSYSVGQKMRKLIIFKGRCKQQHRARHKGSQ